MYWTIRDTNLMWDIIIEKHTYYEYAINRKWKRELSWSKIVLGMGKVRITQG